jgi:ribulose bisphosphate carboxylase small subunit
VLPTIANDIYSWKMGKTFGAESRGPLLFAVTAVMYPKLAAVALVKSGDAKTGWVQSIEGLETQLQKRSLHQVEVLQDRGIQVVEAIRSHPRQGLWKCAEVVGVTAVVDGLRAVAGGGSLRCR